MRFLPSVEMTLENNILILSNMSISGGEKSDLSTAADRRM